LKARTWSKLVIINNGRRMKARIMKKNFEEVVE
jgi:hypothetical protein